MLTRLSLVAFLAVAAALPARAGNMMNHIVRSHCLRAVNQEIRSSGRPAPAGLQDSTCDCVVEQLGKGRSVDQASATCKSLAVQKYGL
jgi:hypothetical protein